VRFQKERWKFPFIKCFSLNIGVFGLTTRSPSAKADY
jgi:hypothetical protein